LRIAFLAPSISLATPFERLRSAYTMFLPPRFAFILGRIALILQNPLFFTSFFRNFANKLAKLLRLSNKNKSICFVLHSTFRNFADQTDKMKQ
jgi:hypothetical protein